MKHKNDVGDILSNVIGDEDLVHFQPSESIKLTFPCILFKFEGFKDFFANDGRHMLREKYSVTHVYQNPEADLKEEILSAFLFASFDRQYIADNLYHDVYTIYY